MAQILIPQPSKGVVITVQSGGYNMTGLTATLLLKLNEPTTSEPVELPLTVQAGGLSGTYTMTGSEFTEAGLYNAQLKVTDGSGLLLYSPQAPNAVWVQSVLG